MKLSLPDNEILQQSLPPAARTVTATGATIDTGRDGYARMAVLDLGLFVDGVHTFTFEDSPDDTVFTPLPVIELDDQEGKLTGNTVVVDAVEDDNTLVKIGLLSVERFVRIVQTITGGPATGLVSGASIVTGNLRAAGGVGQPISVAGIKRIQPSI